jgi:uncharacterized protein
LADVDFVLTFADAKYVNAMDAINTMNRTISRMLNLPEQAVANTLKLLSEGATIPFISRYRKEATGGLDEVQIAAIDTAHQKLVELERRKETIVTTIEEQGKMTEELRARIAPR